MRFITKLFQPKLSKEAFVAYFQTLPSAIEVSWMRDGKYIVGTIRADGEEFMTQGKDASDFIEMVNDAVYAMFNIPDDYIDLIKTCKTSYYPPLEERQKLENEKVPNSVVRLLKDERVIQVA